MNVLALCAGVGGLELGVDLALGGRSRVVCYVEREAFAASVLMARMEDESLEWAPIWDDLTTFDAGGWCGAVDLVCAGFPCQPWSVAGQQRGLDDHRWIWPDIARIIGECEAPLVFLENVPGLLRHGLSEVLADLAALRLDAEWLCLRASDVGAPHQRERLFVLAHAQGWLPWGGWGGVEASDDQGSVAHGRYEHGKLQQQRVRSEPTSGRHGVADPNPALRDESGRGDGASGAGAAIAGDARPFPPGPGDAEGWRRWDGPLPVVRRGSHGLSCRVDRLRALGNAVVPQQAALAFRILAERAGLMERAA